jgi:putative aldouronate transport system substrate-binding protein
MTAIPLNSLKLGRRLFVAGSLSALGLGLAGCGGDEDPDDAKTLRLMLPLFITPPDPAGAMQRAIEDFAGLKLDVTWISAPDYPDRMTVTMASDDLPEVMLVFNKADPTFVKSARAGAFWDLTDKLPDYPNLAASDPEILRNSSINGTQYGIFRWRDPMRSTVTARADWLAQLGLQPPETVDDLRTVAEAFVTERPGGGETTGFVLGQWGSVYGGDSPYEYIETWFGAPNLWGEREGKLVPAFDTEEFFEAQRFMRTMREDGLLKLDLASVSAEETTRQLLNGEFGMLIGTDDTLEGWVADFEGLDAGNAHQYIVQTGNLLGPDGQRHSLPGRGHNGLLVISKQSVPTEAELDEVLSVLDKLNSPEGQSLQVIGIEGTSYTLDGEYYRRIEGAEAETVYNDAQGFEQMLLACNDYHVPELQASTPELQALYEHRKELRVRDLETPVYNAAAAFVADTQIEQGATLNQIIGDARIKFIAGEIDEAGYRDEIARWHSSGGDDVIAEINDLYAEGQ